MPASRGLPLHQLLGIPLADLVEAERMAATASARFMGELGFTSSKPDGDWGQLRFVTFKYTAAEPGTSPVVHKIKIPLLSIVPIPLYQVAKAEFAFSVRVDGLQDAKTSDLKRNEFLVNVTSDETPARVPVIRVKLEATQSDLPAGVASLLRRLDSAMDEESKAS